MSAVAMLQTHLTKVKLEHAEREAALVLRLRKAEAESASLRDELEAAADELQLCWAHVDQLKLENSTKWHVEERDDWRALVTSVQADRTRLQRANAALREEVRRAGGVVPGDLDDASDGDDRPPPPPPPSSPPPPGLGAGASRPSFAVTATPRRRKISLPKPRRWASPGSASAVGLFAWVRFGRKRRRSYSANPILAV